MKNHYSENEQIEDILNRADMPEASAELKRRITAEAREAWNQTSADIPWQVPLRRLAASVAAAVFIIWLANFSSDYTLAQWRPDGPSPTECQPAVFDTLPEIHGPFARHLASVDRRSPVLDASALSDYIESVRKLLDETSENGVPAPAVQPGGSSRLVPGRANTRSYS